MTEIRVSIEQLSELHVSPEHRAVLVLMDLLRWTASDVAELLGTNVSSVDSTLQAARAALAARAAAPPGQTQPRPTPRSLPEER